jgi:2'-phosphotransferase
MSNCREEQGDGGRNAGVNRGRKRHDDKTDKIVALSKLLSKVLRHNAQKEGLNLQADGYVRLDELVGNPGFFF